MVAGGVIAPRLLSFLEHSQLTAGAITRMESITRTRIESTALYKQMGSSIGQHFYGLI